MSRGQSRWSLSPRGLGLTVVLFLVAAPAGAQGISLERLELNPGAAGSLLVGTGELLPQGELRVSTVGQYQQDPLVLYAYSATGNSSTRVGARVSNRLSAHLAAAYSLKHWLEIGAQIPLVAFQRGDNLIDKGFAQPVRYGLSTPSVGVRWGLLSQRDGKVMDVALGLRVGLPLGNASGPMGATSAQFSPQVMLGRRFGWFRLALESQLLVPAPSADQAPSQQEVRFGAVAATVGRRLRWELDVTGSVPLVKDTKPSMNLLVGTRYLVNPSFEMFALGGVGVGSAPGTPLFRVMVGTAFGNVTPPRLPDESSVNCSADLKHTAEECPDLDEDRDGVNNGLDRCPYETGTQERKGCPLRDLDGDGIEDALDACPSEVGEAAWMGCPMPDDDKDGTQNELDSCPASPGPPETRGCPKNDLDEDDVDDDVDLCPKQKGDPKLQGCPESDRDGDTVANRFDSCPNVSGTVLNYGCPPHEIPLVEITQAELLLKSKVYFVPDRAVLDARANEQLKWVVKVIHEHPEFPLISIGAHTDDRGFPNANLQLSQEQAMAVRQYLIERGVAPERLEARGYGGTRPAANNGTMMGREKNRRVEFSIIRND
ncbi:OmpA family protein [Cystobacter ferrugineus]|uniref:Cell envelope biogenesis protein OmpA n=1 Tax=Cystobacter ferrugineus TaxID=83449 RepID=A0A1L9B7A2_9BACT|nr:OmpA family protein [Cystobacter ferrugineus]OJH38139.1 cell envelope biogenesis protein OmpA [Cystobacter ferrugineus]